MTALLLESATRHQAQSSTSPRTCHVTQPSILPRQYCFTGKSGPGDLLSSSGDGATGFVAWGASVLIDIARRWGLYDLDQVCSWLAAGRLTASDSPVVYGAASANEVKINGTTVMRRMFSHS